ncbi:hypothetical protein P153DRAFT_208906 [Dothidotthia symphoricarpi CBS 119687]|uniref:WW domain-containing protein n=1 Tax=Dothidotthia symphoricarpi CBS 119687 TaxID=1392245 RepID=A0A6A6AIU5_9PLEO|nr:uncharacterized protein P153DRAFT_208906 [Dothidotthia symphoricarpi CBS 119687]KAF2131015.1 hypothetical protein P153DRAFT_208906 [Dothidotthia symphoricarpi CBS 119687]
MGFLNELISDFTGQGGQSQNSGSQNQSSQGPPPVSPPWVAEWDGRDNRWMFVNQQTGERTYNHPGQGYGQQQQGNSGYGQGGGYQQQQGNSGYGQGGGYQQGQQEQKQGGNAWKYAAGGAAGLAGGALLMHEGEEMNGWDRDENRIANDFENAPENAANWAGQEVGRVDNFGDRVENKWDNTVNDVENFPEDAAQWTGEKVQAVEDVPQDIENKWDNAANDVDQFGDRMDNSYDQGRNEQRYDDDNNNNDW